jgi:hypothetical protein
LVHLDFTYLGCVVKGVDAGRSACNTNATVNQLRAVDGTPAEQGTNRIQISLKLEYQGGLQPVGSA